MRKKPDTSYITPEYREVKRQQALIQFRNGMSMETRNKLSRIKKENGSHTLDRNPNWLGDNVGYHGIHAWLKNHHGKANRCEANPCTQKSKKFEWALKKGKKYERNRENFMMMCVGCHKKYDITEETKKKISNTLKSK